MRDYLNESFPNRWLGRGWPVAWPPRSPDLAPFDYYLWCHMKTLVYETKVESRTALRDRIFAAAEHIRNHPNNIGSPTQSLLMRAETALQLVEDTLNNYSKAGTYFSSYVVGLYRNAQSAMLLHRWAFMSHVCCLEP